METNVPKNLVQAAMHKDFFDRCSIAIENEYYLEAIFMEYAAMEGRLEVLLGVLGASCNNKLPDKERNKIQISHRVSCFKNLFKNQDIFGKSKLNCVFFRRLEKWISLRNGYIHGLYKNEVKYKKRMKDRDFAIEGLALCGELYNEVNRIKRLRKKSPELFYNINFCSSKSCEYHSDFTN